MKRLTDENLRRVAAYIIANSRILERRRFDYLFGSGRADPVVAALMPYRNEDGGFGNALEPDGRGPGSQPFATLAALDFLDEAGALGGELATGVCDYLVSVSGPDGGVPFVHPNARDYPRAPWWSISDESSLIPTANLAGVLYKNKVDHPWLGPATEFCWHAIDALTGTHPYEVLGCVAFLDHVPDRSRAESAAARIGSLVRQGNLAILSDSDGSTPDGFGEGELHYPHDYASTPDSVARRWFSDEELEWSLDRLVEFQQDDGSWPVRWGIWTPVTAYEWGGWVTIEALNILRAYGRITPAG